MDEKNPQQVSEMFDSIAGSYDLLNRLLSFGIDKRWRNKLITTAKQNNPKTALDVATGTADLPILMRNEMPILEKIIGIDISNNMLAVGQKKIVVNKINNIELLNGSACDLKFDDESFSLVTIAFGIRNVHDIQEALSEFYRVLKPGGQLLILEFSMPKNFFIKSLYLLYFRYILPFIGGIISKNKKAYKYLNSSVEAFPSGDAFLNILASKKFKDLKQTKLTFGIASIYIGQK